MDTPALSPSTPVVPVNSPNIIQGASSYNKTCAVAYGAYRLAQVLIIPAKFPGAERLEHYLRGKLTEAAVESVIGYAFRKISGQSTDDAIGDFVQKVQAGALNLGEGYLAQAGTAVMAPVLQSIILGGIDQASPEAGQEAARRVVNYGKVPLYLFTAYVGAYREQAWAEFDELMGIDKRLCRYNITSEKFWGGDTMRKGIKFLLRFLVDIFIVEPHKDEAMPYRWAVVITKEGSTGGVEWGKALGITSLKGKAAMGAVGLAVNYGLYVANPLLGIPLGLVSYFGGPEAKQVATGLSAVYWANTLFGAVGLGAAGATGLAVPMALLYMRQHHPEKWAELCELMPSFKAADKALPDDYLESRKIIDMTEYDPLLDISRLYGLEDLAALEKSAKLLDAQVEHGLIIAGAEARIGMHYAEMKALKAQAGVSLETFKAINDSIAAEMAVVKEADDALKACVAEHAALEESSPEVKLSLTRKMMFGKMMELAMAEEKVTAPAMLSGDIAKAVERAEGLREEIKLLRSTFPKLEDKEAALRVQAIEEELSILSGRVQMMTESLMKSTYNTEDADEAELYKALQVEADTLMKAAEKKANSLKAEDRVRGIVLNPDSVLARMEAMQSVCSKLVIEKKDVLATRLENAKAASEAATVAFNEAEAVYKTVLKERAEVALVNLPNVDETTPPLEVVKRLLVVANIFKDGHAEVANIDAALANLKQSIESLRATHPNLAKQMEDNGLLLQYRNIFPLDNARNFTTVVKDEENVVVHVEAFGMMGAPEELYRPDAAGSGSVENARTVVKLSAGKEEVTFSANKVQDIAGEILQGDFYTLPKNPVGRFDRRFIEQMADLNIYIGGGSEKKTLNERYDEEYGENGTEIDLMNVMTREDWTLHQLKESTRSLVRGGNVGEVDEVMAGRISQLLNEEVGSKVASVASNFVSGKGGVFVPYGGNYLHVADAAKPVYEFYISPAAGGVVNVTIQAKWKVDGHASGPDAEVHALSANKPSTFEAAFVFQLKPPAMPKAPEVQGWAAWAWSGAKAAVGLGVEELKAEDFEIGIANVTAALNTHAFIATVRDTLVADIKVVQD